MTLWQRVAGLPAGRVTKWITLIGWVALLMLALPLAGKLGEVTENDEAAFLPRSAESTKVAALEDRFSDSDTVPAVVVYERAGGIGEADRAAAERDRERLAPLVEGEEIPPPVPSEDGAALMLVAPLADGEETLIDGVEDVREEVRAGAPGGLSVQVTGPAGTTADFVEVFDGIDTTVLMATVTVVTILLLLTYRSPVLWLLPLISVGVASQIGSGVVYLLAEHAGLTVNDQSAAILVILVFGAGTDYALLLVARYREELHRHVDRHQAMAVALRRAGPAILASAGTVAIGLLCLLAAELNSNRDLGPVGAIGIVAALLALTTLLPALLVILGRWVFWPLVPRAGTPTRETRSAWARVGAAVARRPRVVWAVTAVVLGAFAFGAAGAKTGLTGPDVFTTTPEGVAGQQVLAKHYPAGAGDPAVVLADASAEQEVTAAIRSTEGVSEVLAPERSGDLVRIPAVLSDPPDTGAAEQAIERLRDSVHAVPGADALVGGSTAIGLDTHNAVDHDERAVIPLVLVVVLIVLILLLRSLIAPLLLVATVALSFLAALGASRMIFEGILGFPAFDYGLVLFGFVFLVALGIDYNIFLMTRVREEVARAGHREGVLRGLAVTGGVITSAGLVLAGTFSVLTGLPLVGMVQLGFLVAFGVLLDTFVVRSVLVPALALDVGPRIWWPSRLARRGHDESTWRTGLHERTPAAR